MTGDSGRGRVLVAGSANVDYVVRAPRIPQPGETVLGGDLATWPGGKGANQAVASARAGGTPTRMLAALGADAGGRLVSDALAAAGVALEAVVRDRPTGAALITVSDEGENAIAVAVGANATLSPRDLPDLTGVSWLVMQLETPIETVLAFARAARAGGVRVLLNAAPAQTLPPELLTLVDVLVANEDELAAVAGEHDAVARRLTSLGVPTVVVTLGAKGCCAWSHAGYVVQPAFRVATVDTTAAGDTFCGVLAAELAGGAALPAALRGAAAAAALSTTRRGAQSSVPAREEVRRLVAQHGDDAQAVAALRAYCEID